MKRVCFVLGTRPEAIKLAPVILGAAEHPEFEPNVCVTGQHREMLDQVLEVFGIVPDMDLALMQPNQTLGSLTGRAITAIDAYLADTRPDMVIVQGDTTTVFCAALCAFYHNIPVGHVEAGLRTWNRRSPFPEEANRVLTSFVADYHFAPTEQSKRNLLQERIPEERVIVTGNTVIDALFVALAKVRKDPPAIPGLPANLLSPANRRPIVLITGHRRESFGQGFEGICQAILSLAQRFSDHDFVYPVHLNPNVREPVFRMLSDQQNIHLIAPLPYLPFVALIDRARLILTDSGGVQEEAPSLGKPVLVMRENTERPEAVSAGTAKLVGTRPETIVSAATTLLTDRAAYLAMSRAANPYGDGKATERILNACVRFLYAH